MRPKQINILAKKVSQVTKIFEQEYKNPFEIHINKEKLVNISSGAALDDDIAEVYLIWLVGRLVSKEIFHAPIKKNNYKSFPHVKLKIQITKKGEVSKMQK